MLPSGNIATLAAACRIHGNQCKYVLTPTCQYQVVNMAFKDHHLPLFYKVTMVTGPMSAVFFFITSVQGLEISVLMLDFILLTFGQM